VERPARARQPHHEHPQLDQHPGDLRVELAEVHLGLRTWRVRLRHHDLHLVQVQLGAAAGDIPRDRHLGHARAVLGDQPLPDPPGRMPLLAGYLPVRQQPLVDHGLIRADRRPGPRRVRLARRRHRAGQRLPHRTPVHMMPVSQLPDR
jgi:hypothetical protein